MPEIKPPTTQPILDQRQLKVRVHFDYSIVENPDIIMINSPRRMGVKSEYDRINNKVALKINQAIRDIERKINIELQDNRI